MGEAYVLHYPYLVQIPTFLIAPKFKNVELCGAWFFDGHSVVAFPYLAIFPVV